MSLLTRCSACGTVFRVAQDQLRVSDGWVRCGRCDAVFDALETLGDPAGSTGPTEEAAQPASPARSRIDTADDDRYQASVDIDALLKRRVEAQVVAPSSYDEQSPADPADDDETALRHEPARAVDALPDATMPASAEADTTGTGLSPAAPAAVAATVASPAAPPPSAKPQFVRRAERDARWHSPAMRIALVGSSLLLLLLLLAQVAYHRRDHLAAQSPAAARWLQAACERWNCSIGPPRSIDELVIEHSSLARLPQRPEALQLTLRIANRAGVERALPAVELSLTDAEGRLIARRALWPTDFGVVAPAVVSAQSELPLQLLFATGERIVSGYTVELFYP